ncbi:hypothetical protein OMP38_20625 [Cohnella ginsengisoli]|uniref:BclA C-terminal domain-containing protein n=1 Tax=Cohnella ginsengisoli TaxID=425004 RepID=A0A9X4KJQ3_9BACL|nr:hypothetical protein [Cohnella ginsengisoli]MDG0793006.1 hypothetical protein [Cohnella ginsengisoli]
MVHAAGTTKFTVANNGIYKVSYSVSLTGGIGAQIAVARNGIVDSGTPIGVINAAGNFSGVALLSLSAGDFLTLRNNSLTVLTLVLAPSVGAQFTIEQID